MASEITATRNVGPTAPKTPAPMVAKADKTAVIAKDKLVVAKRPAKTEEPAKKAPPSPAAAAPGEEVRNKLSIGGQILGPIVTIKQSLGMLANLTIKNPLVKGLVHGLVRGSTFLGTKLSFLRSPAVTTGLKWIGRGLPFLSAGILAFDAYATYHTFTTPGASTLRKGLTLGRFISNAVATAVSFIPGAGMVYALIPAWIGNGFEFAMMKLNADEAKKTSK